MNLTTKQSSAASMRRISNEEFFDGLEFEKVEFDNGITCYKGVDGGFYRVDYCGGLDSYIIEYAENEEEARNNMFEDDDLFDDSLHREEIIEQVRNALIEYVKE